MELIRKPHGETSLWDDLFEIRDNFNRLFDAPLLRAFDSNLPAREGMFAPEVDITGNDDEIVIHADLPGVEAKDVHIDVSNNILTISGERREETEKKEKNSYRTERFFGSFQRSFSLPEGMDSDKVKASYKNGVLTVTIPKSEKVKPKQISIEVEE